MNRAIFIAGISFALVSACGSAHAQTKPSPTAPVKAEATGADAAFAAWDVDRNGSLSPQEFRNGWDLIPQPTRDALVMTVFNRGTSTAGSRRAEVRVIRDVCVPAGDVACVVAQLRLMPRLWVGTPAENGLRNRYTLTAKYAESGL